MHVSRGRRVHAGAFTLQVNRRRVAVGTEPDPQAAARIGFTVTKKVGNAVVRNRIRRRMREALRLSEALSTEPGSDYVIVAKRDALAVPFVRLVAELEGAVRRCGPRKGPRAVRDGGRGD